MPIVVPQHAAESLPAANLPDVALDVVSRFDQLVRQPLMISLAVIMSEVLSNSPVQ